MIEVILPRFPKKVLAFPFRKCYNLKPLWRDSCETDVAVKFDQKNDA